MSISPPWCFVIGPIGDKSAEIGSEARGAYEENIQVWEHVIEPATRALGIEATRADRIPSPGEIGEQIFRRLRDAPVVIADVTGANPNVMYELGLRHTQDKVTIQIGEIRRLPFDIQVIRTIRFRRSEAGLIEARNELIAALESALADDFLAVTATRVWNEVASTAPEPESLEVSEDESEEEGFLELLAKSEEVLPDLSAVIEEMSQAGAELSDLMNATTEQVLQSDEAGGGSPGRLKVALRFAHDLTSHAERMESLSRRYEGVLQAIDPGVTYLISQVEDQPQLLQEVPDFRSSLSELAGSTREMITLVDGSADTVQELGKIARPLRRPSNQLANAYRRVTAASVVIGNWESRLERVVTGE